MCIKILYNLNVGTNIFPNFIGFLAPKIDFVLANSADSDKMPHNAAFLLGLLFSKVPITVDPVYRGLRLGICFLHDI